MIKMTNYYCKKLANTLLLYTDSNYLVHTEIHLVAG